VDALCQRMEMMIAKFDEVVGSLESLRHQVPNTSMHIPESTQNEQANEPQMDDFILSNDAQIPLLEYGPADQTDEFDDENNEEADDDLPTAVQDYVMTRDSYGKLR
jgi:hypothetical protein